MSVYCDVSALVALFAVDPLNDRADKALSSIHDSMTVSEFAVTEFSSVIAMRVRMRDLQADEARDAFSNFENWCGLNAQRVEVTDADVIRATTLARRLDLSLRASDALHLAIARRLDARLLTFDRKMATAARNLGTDAVKA